jgi:hypothetical protein
MIALLVEAGGSCDAADPVHAEIDRQIGDAIRADTSIGDLMAGFAHSEDVPDGWDISDQNLDIVRESLLDRLQNEEILSKPEHLHISGNVLGTESINKGEANYNGPVSIPRSSGFVDLSS